MQKVGCISVTVNAGCIGLEYTNIMEHGPLEYEFTICVQLRMVIDYTKSLSGDLTTVCEKKVAQGCFVGIIAGYEVESIHSRAYFLGRIILVWWR